MQTLRQRERDCLAVLHQGRQGLIPASRGAELAGLEVRQFQRLRRIWKRKGDAVVVYSLRSRLSNRAKPSKLRSP